MDLSHVQALMREYVVRTEFVFDGIHYFVVQVALLCLLKAGRSFGLCAFCTPHDRACAAVVEAMVALT